MDEQATAVVFRRWRDSSDTIALFPALPSDIDGWFCLSYEHVGQHGGADYCGVVAATRPATDDETASLAEELARIGYRLQPIKRASRRIHEARRAAAEASRARPL